MAQRENVTKPNNEPQALGRGEAPLTEDAPRQTHSQGLSRFSGRLTIDYVTQSDDSRVDDFRDLNHSDRRPDLPGGKGLVIAEGLLVVPRLINSRYPVRSIMGTESKVESLLDDPQVVTALEEKNVPIRIVEREIAAQVVGFDMHRGLLASADRVVEPSVAEVLDAIDHPGGAGAVKSEVGSGDSDRVVKADSSDKSDGTPSASPRRATVAILEGVGDHENIGSMFRNAAGLGVDAVLFGAGCADPLYRRVIRVSMGHVLRTPFATFEGNRSSWQHNLKELQERGYRVVAMTPNPGSVPLAEALEGADKVAVLVGAEGPGLTEHAMRACDVRARIPMAPGTDSLNVSTAAAMAFYERAREE